MTIFDPYLRKSTKDDGRSVKDQLTEITDYLIAEGHRVGEVYCDPDFSASRFARRERPDYRALMERIRAGESPGVALWEASRGSRNLSEWIAFLEACRDGAVPILVQTHRRIYDARLRRDWRTLAEEGVDSHDESERISERVSRGKRSSAAEGRPVGKLLYGYVRVYNERGKFVEQVVHEDQAVIVREAASRVKAGEAVAHIARDFNTRSVATPTGTGQWHGASVSKMVANPAYAARRIHQGSVIGPGRWPAILDVDVHDACVEILADPVRRTQQGTLLKWKLSGVLICGLCATPMRPHAVTSRGRRSQMYGCPGCWKVNVVTEKIEKLVTMMVHMRLRQIDQGVLFAPPSNDLELAAARREERKLRSRLQDHAVASARGKLSPAMLAAVEAELTPMIEAAAAKARSLARPRELRDLADVDVVAVWPALPVAKQRSVIRAVCETIIVDPAPPGLPFFDQGRIGRSEFRGNDQTWSELWAED